MSQFGGKAICAALLIILPAFPVPAAARETGAGDSALSAALAALQLRDARVQRIGWQLISGNAAFCRHVRPATGLLLEDIAAFSEADAIRASLGLTGDIAVEAAAPGSPAGRANVPVHAQVLTLDGAVMADLPPPGKQRWLRLQKLNQAMDAGLAKSGSVTLTWQYGKQAPVTTKLVGVPACPTRFEVITASKQVSANGTRVAVGEAFIGFTYGDGLLAAAIAHEVAHNVLGHPAWLDAHGRSQRNIRRTEREADRLMPWLLANAGYPPSDAEVFMRTWGPGHDGGLFRNRSHAGWDERADAIAAELPIVRQALTQAEKADWDALFKRDIAPDVVPGPAAESAAQAAAQAAVSSGSSNL